MLAVGAIPARDSEPSTVKRSSRPVGFQVRDVGELTRYLAAFPQDSGTVSYVADGQTCRGHNQRIRRAPTA